MNPKPLRKYKRERPREHRAVTIGLGFTCNDGVVLCADRQITDNVGLKYEKTKVSLHQVASALHRGEKVLVAFGITYAGDPDKAKVLADSLSLKITEQIFRWPHDESAKRIIESCLRSSNARPESVLIAFQTKASSAWRKPFLIRTSGTKVVHGFREYIGVGDSSVIRYLDTLVGSKIREIAQAERIGAYMVSVANTCVDRCSGGPDILTLRDREGPAGIKKGVSVGNIEDELSRVIFVTLQKEKAPTGIGA